MFNRNEIEPEEPRFEGPQGPQPLGWSANQYAMRYGIIVGFCMALDFIFSAAEGWTKYLSLFIEVYLMIQTFRMGIIYKIQEKGGVIRYGEAWKFVFLLFFYGAIIAAGIRLVYMLWINPEFLGTMRDTFVTSFTEALQQEKYAEQKEAVMGMMTTISDKVFMPAPYTICFMISDCLLGALLGALYAAFLSSKKIKL